MYFSPKHDIVCRITVASSEKKHCFIMNYTLDLIAIKTRALFCNVEKVNATSVISCL